MIFTDKTYAENILSEAADKDYQTFTSRLTNTKYPILGVRIPKLQTMAKRILQGDYSAFLALSFTYFEHHLLRGMVCAMNREGEKEHLALFAEFIPYIDDWEGVDLIASRYKNSSESYFSALTEYLRDRREYAVRFALVALLSNFAATPRAGEAVRLVRSLTHCGYMEKFARAAKSPQRSAQNAQLAGTTPAQNSAPHLERQEPRLGGYIPTLAPAVCGSATPPCGYYVLMGTAWLLSVLYLTEKSAVLSYLSDPAQDPATRLKTISKILDSFRVPPDEKQSLRALRQVIKEEGR